MFPRGEGESMRLDGPSGKEKRIVSRSLQSTEKGCLRYGGFCGIFEGDASEGGRGQSALVQVIYTPLWVVPAFHVKQVNQKSLQVETEMHRPLGTGHQFAMYGSTGLLRSPLPETSIQSSQCHIQSQSGGAAARR